MKLHEGITFAHNLCLCHFRHRWKGITKEHNSENGPKNTFFMVYPKHEPRKLNTNIFVKLEVVSWYINFLRA